MSRTAPNAAGKAFPLLSRNLPTCWAERILIFIIVIFWSRWDSRFPCFQIDPTLVSFRVAHQRAHPIGPPEGPSEGQVYLPRSASGGFFQFENPFTCHIPFIRNTPFSLPSAAQFGGHSIRKCSS